ncbi:hypothetical protein C8R46DRAFT_1070260 [Mycena filopes]|nr:hypothetical protein C8R46DRAFT_1070260 [Mycena filopes]
MSTQEVSAFSSPEVVQSAQRQIDNEIQHFQNSIRGLQSQRNALSAVGRLPAEMLSRIFLFCSRQVPHSLSWIKEVSHICRHWRAVALGCPNLWCSITFSRPKWAAEMLKRSKMAPLRIRVNADYLTPKVIEAVHSSLGQISRTEELDVAGGSVIQEILNLTDPAPYLHSLSLSLLSHWQTSPERVVLPADFLNGEAPRLRKIELTGFSIPWDSPLMSNLVNLKVMNPGAPPPPSSMNELVEALGRMPLLETLELENVLPTLAEDITTICVPSVRAQLPCLKRIVLVSYVSVLQVADTLNHLSYPSTTSMKISCRASSGSCGGFTSLIPTLSNLQRGVKSHHSLRVHFDVTRLNITLFQPDSQPRSHFLELELNWNEHRRDLSLLPFICKALPLQRLRSLYIVSGDIDARTWLGSFADLPCLRDIRFHGEATEFITVLREDVFLDGTKQAPQIPAVKPVGHGRRASLRKPREENVSGGLFFPALRYLTLEDADFSPPVLDMLKSALMERCERKQNLWSLTLQECIMLTSDNVRELEEIVPDVIWDEVERGFTEDEEDFSDFSDMSTSDLEEYGGYWGGHRTRVSW